MHVNEPTYFISETFTDHKHLAVAFMRLKWIVYWYFARVILLDSV